MKKDLSIRAHDGGEFYAFAAYPDTDLPAPAVVVIQEIFGVNDVMRMTCENLARAGYIAVCPDLFWRMEPRVELSDQKDEDWKKAFELYKAFDLDKGVEDLKAALAFVRADEQCTGQAGTIGYCLGGRLAFLMATRSDADCNVSYYGVALENHLGEAGAIHRPLLMHIAEKDQFVPLEAQEQILHSLNGLDNVEIHVYSGVDHAFARPGGAHYDKEAARQANARTADFLATALSRGRRRKSGT